MKQRYQTVLLDADNTLFDFNAAEEQALRRSMERRGLAFSRERLGRYTAINRELWDAFHRGQVEQEWLSVERFRRFGALLGWTGDPAAWDAEYLDFLGDCGALLPGALELLEALKPHCRLGLATNGLRAVQRKRLAGSPAAPYFDGVFISQEMGVGKPEAVYFQRILEALEARPETTLMVGDDLLSDIQGAINAGLDCVWYSPRGEDSPLPTYRVRELKEIKELVFGER